ncbi:nitrilase [Oceanotoga sp. DSM 15011]|jgi:predicted amidohydrolase|uniref:Amidohydrolase n=1 Tax=Oceanotoga teriensis TaxID=515440 RepID=A0AA45C8Y6_9BACT|nr:MULTISPECIES: nitrilase-related carbon-nitrogen hydrolase [Oceanotoga]MDO7975411.1 nitrilase [Oceanotoga teriensis]PWJ96301.1 putative amidohydrolase [Oceanotoga teriensis]UYP00085.1 nitrilase [Oceanotoga sp. DSM 15011]
MFNVSILQYKIEFLKKKKNLDFVVNAIKNLKDTTLVLPELAFTGYSFKNKNELEYVYESPMENQGIVFKTLKNLSLKNNLNIVYGFVEKENTSYYNSACMITKYGNIEVYRKTHLFYKEKLFFDNGNTGFKVVEVDNIKYGIAICFDWFFPESFRKLSKMNSDIILHPSNLVMPYCQEASKTRALENKIFIATSNTYGEQKNNDVSYNFTGMSQLTSPNGEIINRFSKDSFELKTFSIDEKLSRNKYLNDYNNIFSDLKENFY